jgi:hypothetical protein
MFVWLRGQGFESSFNKVFLKEKLANSKTIRFTILIKGVQQELTCFSVTIFSYAIKAITSHCLVSNRWGELQTIS